MDVRCEKCNTEYELDESRLKPGGVTVKCTTCGHMFKIRKRSPTQSGVPARPVTNAPPHGSAASAPPRAGSAGPTPAPAPPAPSRGVPQERAQTGSGPVSGPIGGEGDRQWVLRLDNGETRSCRELGTLQQWIITGLVSRDSMISRSGKTWKRLGDIAELSSFFIVAQEARDARDHRDSGRITPTRVPAVGVAAIKTPERETVVEPMRVPITGRNLAPPPPPASTQRQPTSPAPVAPPPRLTSAGAAVAPPRPAMSTPPPPPRPLASAAAAPTLPAHAPTMVPNLPAVIPDVPSRPVASPSRPAPPPPRSTAVAAASAPLPPPPAVAAIPPPAQRSTGAWVTDDVRPLADELEGEGPRRGAVRSTGQDNNFGGVVRPVPTDDVAFAGGLNARRDDGDNYDPFADDEPPRRRGAGLWIALGSLVVIGAAAGVVYFTVLRPAPNRSDQVADAGLVAAVVVDAGAVAAGPDAAVVSPADDLLDQARVQLGRDSSAALSAAEKLLADGGRADATTLGMRARLISAQAQIIEDEAELATDSKTAEKVRRQGKQLVLSALGLAQRAIKAGNGNALANVAMADVLRLQGKPMKDLRRYLDTARQAAPGDHEAGLVEALTALRDKDYDRAIELLRGLDQGSLEGTGDVRPRWHLARVAFAQRKQDDARSAAAAVVAAQPEHGGARAMLARLGAVAVDPMPDEDVDAGVGAGSAAGGPDAGSSSGSGSGAVSGNDYDKLLAKANKLAEVDCGQAMPYFTRALEVQPNGVEALSGMGFCHIDAKQFASAHSKFRAALGISPRFERALWGVAEAYQQQGRTDLAIGAYEKYLEVYPNGAAAQRQLERLKGTGGGTPTPPEGGGGGGGGSGSDGTGSAEKPVDPPKPDEPKPDPVPSPDPGAPP